MLPVTWEDHEMQSLVGVLFVALATASLVTAQTANPRRTVWDGVYTEAQAARGTTAYGQSCAGCHALATEGKAPLVGDPFWKSFAQKNVGDLLEFVSTYMPNGNPGSLTEPTYRDIVALILKSNGFPAGTTELGGNASVSVQIVQKDGRTELPANALARVVGCLTKNGADWVVTSATTPERAEREGQRVIDAAIEAARIRLRPILMTSFAFIFGVLPLALATGAGANSRAAIGTAVVGGMLTATILAIFYIPFFFVLVRRGVRDGLVVIRERLRQRRREAQA